MTLLDRAIARTYLLNVAVLMVIIFSFVVAVDVSLNFDTFVELAVLRGGAPGGGEPSALRTGLVACALVVDLWWPRLVQLFGLMLGLMMIGGAGFTLAQMVRHRELVAMLAGGISLWRAARPILICAVGLSLLQLANHEFVLPRIAPLLTRDHKQAGERVLGAARIRPTADAGGRVFRAESFDPDAGVIRGLHVLERDESGRATRSISAAEAVYREKGWRLTEGFAVSFREAGGAPQPVAFIPTDLDPASLTLRRFVGYRSNLSWRQIGEMVSRPGESSERSAGLIEDLERIRYGRLSVAACNLLALVICVPFFLRREPAAMLGPALRCAPVAVASLMGGVLGTAAAIPGLPPQVSVFVPALVLLPLAIASATSVKT